MNPETPLGEGFKRAIINAVITLVYTAFLTYQGLLKAAQVAGVQLSETDAIKEAIIAGFVVALAPFVIQSAQGAMDQKRADKGIVSAADVPIAISARVNKTTPKTAVNDFAPTKLAA